MSDPAGMLSCREVVELVTAYLEGALSEIDEVRFEEHLAMCDGCAAYLDQMRKTIRLVGKVDAESIDLEACNRLMHAFQGWKAGRDHPPGG
jgi:predicted anti-sigma-YlaC factor YlaD